MTREIKLLMAVLALAAAPARVRATPEALALGAAQSFTNAAFFEGLPELPVMQLSAMPSPTPFNITALAPMGSKNIAGVKTQVGKIDLASLLNKQLKSPLKYSLGGKDVWVSGAFDREKNPYVSILVDGSQARFFNVKGLLNKEEEVVAGTAKYKLYLVGNPLNQLKSEIVLENAANEDDKVGITIKKMIEGIKAVGAAVAVSGQNYKVFYTDDIKNGQVDKTAQSFTFILTDTAGGVHIFLIPANFVLADEIKVFAMFANSRIGLRQKNGQLEIYENP